MAQVLVVADDLTGANATGARFARAGMRVATVTPEHVRTAVQEFDAVVVDLDSRHLPPARAAELVSEAVAAAWPVPLVVKRTDTTLRGNIGAELEAAWRAVRARTPDSLRVRALFAPAFPSSGRVTADGVQLLDGVPLERTELALDPLSPITGSVVADIVALQSELPVRSVRLREVAGAGDLAGRLSDGYEPVVLCDALTEEHLAGIARAAAEVHRRDGTVWVAVDPGPSGALLAEALGLAAGSAEPPAPLLAVVGSATEVTRRQLAAAHRADGVRFVDVDVRALTEEQPGYAAALAAEIAAALAATSFPDAVVARTASEARDVVELPFAAKRALPRLLAEVVRAAVDAGAPSGLYTSGGDVTSAVLEELGAHAFEVGGEVVPLAVHGTLVGGAYQGTPVVTKGGLIGDDTTVAACLDRLRRAVLARARTVSAEVGGRQG
ncbi:four-carbon acid sugar kinase family protein [Nocardiopsis coralliicola]